MRKGSRPSTISSLFNKRAEVLLIGKHRNLAVLQKLRAKFSLWKWDLITSIEPPPNEFIWKLLEQAE